MKVTLIVKDGFEAAHYIPKHKKCGKVHGHSYKVTVEFTGEIKYGQNWLTDFANLKKVVKEVLGKLDHTCINQEIAYPATAEFIAKWIFNQLKEALSIQKRVKVKSVTVFETEECGAKIEEEDV